MAITLLEHEDASWRQSEAQQQSRTPCAPCSDRWALPSPCLQRRSWSRTHMQHPGGIQTSIMTSHVRHTCSATSGCVHPCDPAQVPFAASLAVYVLFVPATMMGMLCGKAAFAGKAGDAEVADADAPAERSFTCLRA